MKKYLLILCLSCLVWLCSSFIIIHSKTEAVDFPEGYREWNHIKTYLVGPNNAAWPKYGGFNHYYANDKALEGYRTNIYPDGSIIVVDVREALDRKGDHALGKRKFIDVMVKDSKRYASTGGWGFEEFMEGNKSKAALDDAAKTKCFKCHQSRAATEDLVLSKME
jgi:hypothetical protein